SSLALAGGTIKDTATNNATLTLPTVGGASSLGGQKNITIDTTAPTISSATVAADGVTVTVTWSENLDQTQAVPGSAFSIAPNSGSSIAGTAAAVSYPAANQTRFTLDRKSDV